MKIAAFNIRMSGMTKISRPDVLSVLVKIASRYDILVILEMADITGMAVDLLMKELNRVNAKHHYAHQLSSRLKGGTSVEQFLFLYRDDLVDLVDCYQYGDDQVGSTDAFARDPYILLFKPCNTVLRALVLIPVCASPWDTERELDELYDVFLAVKHKWKTDNVMILGDLKADGAHVTQRGMAEVRIRGDKNFHWLIGDGPDTTVTTTDAHTYDRIIVYGRDMLRAVVPNSAKPFNFKEEFSITEEMASQVSDRYPVEVELQSCTPFWMTETCQRRDIADARPVSGHKAVRESLKEDVLKLQKENLELEQEKLYLQISLLKQRLASLSR